MTRGWIAAAFAFALLSGAAIAPSRAADPAPTGVATPEPSAGGGIVVGGPGHEATLTPAVLATLPAVQVAMPPGTSTPGAAERSFEGPLLWTVLVHAGVVDPAKHQDDVRRTMVLTGSDGYTAVLALGEISPEFENKRVILALRADGQALAAGHLRVVVPGDKRGGRGVHELAHIAVGSAIPAARQEVAH